MQTMRGIVEVALSPFWVVRFEAPWLNFTIARRKIVHDCETDIG
jgi:hypothetical protein